MRAHTLHRPTPLLDHDATPVDRRTRAWDAARRLRGGERLLVTDHYGTGVAILEALRGQVPAPDGGSYAERQAHRDRLRAVEERLLAPIRNHWLALKDAGAMELLVELYPDTPDFFLPLVDVQEIHGASVRYRNGVKLAVLGYALHPFYGTYAPTRTSHLELFGTWLSQYKGSRGHAVDVGTGSGVLALMLAKAGFETVLATDCNPNAVESVRREVRRRAEAGVPVPIEPRTADLLGEDGRLADLIVFNPPWLQGEARRLLDRALMYEDPALFERFFDGALDRLAPGGRIVLVFSDIGELAQPDAVHPIEAELSRGRFELADKLKRKVKGRPDASGRRRRTRERVEIWELKRSE